MSANLALNLFALLSLVPAALSPLRADKGRDGAMVGALALAAAGSAAFAGLLLSGAWQTDLGTTVWVSIAASAILFTAIAVSTRQGWRLAPLLMPYLIVMGVLASVVRGAPKPMVGGAPAVWLDAHIIVSVVTYALLTLAAVASLAVFLQERALKTKHPTRLSRMLPSVLDGERLADRLLLATEVVLGVGIATGMATQYFETGALLVADHKTLLSLVAFVLIGVLLAGHRVCGVRGRLAARVVLVSYLLLTLAFPGVKFVTQVLL